MSKSKEEPGFVRTSIKLAREVWEEAQIAAIRSGLTFTQVVEAALKRYLEIKEHERLRREKR